MPHKYKTHVTYSDRVCPAKSAEDICADLLGQLFGGVEGAVLIAVGGPGGTGKTTFSKKLAKLLGDADVLRLDDYKTPRSVRSGQNLYGAHPKANEMDLIAEHLQAVKQMQPIQKPVYDNVAGEATSIEVYKPCKFNIIDGEISTYRKFRDHIDFSIFIDSDWKTQLGTRISRDIELRGYSREKAISTFLQSNLKEFSKYGAESKKWADVHLYCRADYTLVVESVAQELYEHFESLLAQYVRTVDLSGLIVPVATPFADSFAVDRKMFIEHLEFLAKHGVSRILVNGTTGEFFSLVAEERKMLLKLSREYFPGLIIFQAGCDSLAMTQAEVGWAQDYGADAIMSLPPFYYADAPARGIVDYFNTLSKQTDLPFLLYNFPKHTQNPMTPEILSQIDHYGMKDSSANLSLIGSTPHYYVGGDDEILQACQNGAYGFVSGMSNCVPDIFTAMENAVGQDCEKAQHIQAEITRLGVHLNKENSIARIKYVLSKRIPGYPNTVRLPLVPLGDDEIAEMDGILESLDAD